ncbi:MAG: amino acid adenylation domain-containing protein, partial [bacterium]|nr:amino acid adenylation domain-containing protein [bacterium]
RAVLEDSRAPVLVTAGGSGERWPEGIRVVDLDGDSGAIAAASPQSPALSTAGDELAYVIYTSGSTGRPKGVGVTHANVLRLFTATRAWFGFDRDDVFTLFHSYAFDFSVWELWGALLHGGRLVLVPYWVSRSPEAFLELLDQQGVTVLNQTPSAFSQLVHEQESSPSPSSSSSLRWVIFGGEALNVASLAPWFARHGDRRPRLVNMYGITETTVHVTYRRLSAADLVRSGRSPIGAGIPDLRIALLDRSRNPVPLGVVGEMFVGGAGVARGYLGRPALTAERFVPDPLSGDPLSGDPFSPSPGERLYRTGDLGRYQPDGDLEFLGRTDHQVKIRGFRIELGEIEAVLADHPAVATAVVMVSQDEAAVLVAWVVGAGTAEPSRSELRSFLTERLPEYMVPAIFVPLESLPLTPNGKVDRAALARRALPNRVAPEAASVPPRTPAEVALARIWSRVLGVERVGVNDNFFELGGDSILSIQVVSGARQEGLVLTPRDVFHQPTLGELAAVATTATRDPDDQGPVTGELPLTPIQRWFFEWQLSAPHHFNQALLLETRERLEPARLERALGVLMEHHDALRLRFTRTGDAWRQVNDRPGAAVPFARVDLSVLEAGRRRPALEMAATAVQGSLELSRGPLVRLIYFDFGSEHSARLQWVIHHLAVDGVSWRILLQDLERIYRVLERGEAVALPPRTTPYKRWAEKLTARAGSAAVTDELAFWESQAKEGGGELPVDHPGGLNTLTSARGVTVSLPADDTRALLKEVHDAYRTRINDLLLAALVQAFGEWTGNRTLLVGMEGHGREELDEELDLSRTVGWFTSIFPVLLERAGDPGDLLKAVKERLRAVPGGGVDYGLLRYLNEETARRLVKLPPARVIFNYLGQLDVALPPTSALRPAVESAGSVIGPEGRRRHLLEI